MNSIPPTKEENAISQVHMNGVFLEKPGLLKEALKREDEWARAVPGYDSTMARRKRPMSNLERSLYKLNAVRELGEWANEFIDMNAEAEDDGNDGNFGRPIALSQDVLNEMDKETERQVEVEMQKLEIEQQFDTETSEKSSNGTKTATTSMTTESLQANMIIDETTAAANGTDGAVQPTIYSQPCVTSMPIAPMLSNEGNIPIRRDSVIVIIRHGKTQHNKLGLFTGWVSCTNYSCSLLFFVAPQTILAILPSKKEKTMKYSVN